MYYNHYIITTLSLLSTLSRYYTLIMYLVVIVVMISKQYSNFYRSIKLQLTLKREDRVLIKDFIINDLK